MLMADGRTRLIGALGPGDVVYGTRVDGRRRYELTTVISRQSRLQLANRIWFADGCELLVGADQRILTYRGWKHATGRQQGRRRRPHVTRHGRALGTGRFAAAVPKSAGYQRGYLCGLIRGDGHVGSYVCRPPGKPPWTKHGFRLAMSDVEALDRADAYLSRARVDLTRFEFAAATATRRGLLALGTQSRVGVDRVRELIEWPSSPTDAWRAGFLAGIFDAEGSCAAREALRIANSDPAIVECTERCARRFRFETVREVTARPNGMTYVRLRGGLRERLRFFHTVDPAITRKRGFVGLALQSDADLRVASAEPLGERIRMHAVATRSGDLIANGVVVGAGS